jgi:hypothetical protein
MSIAMVIMMCKWKIATMQRGAVAAAAVAAVAAAVVGIHLPPRVCQQ